MKNWKEEDTEKWALINEPWFEIEGFDQILLYKLNFLDILEECDVEYGASSSGEFTHKAKCPLPIHDFGGERTASMFINIDKNTFYCFGCNSGGNLINFVSLYKGMPFHQASRYLSKYIEIKDCDIENIDISERRRNSPEDMVETYVFKSGLIIREYLSSIKGTKDYPKKCLWAEKQFKKLDSFLDSGNEAVPKAKVYAEKLPKYLEGNK